MQKLEKDGGSVFDADKATLIVTLQKTRVYKPGTLYRSETGTFHYLLRDGGVPPYALTAEQAERIVRRHALAKYFEIFGEPP